MDQYSWKKERLLSIHWLENFLAKLGLEFCFSCYCCDQPGFFENRLTLSDLIQLDGFTCYPPLFLVCGDKDPLLFSNQAVCQQMQEKRALVAQMGKKLFQIGPVELKTYHARHAFIGLPPAWLEPKLKIEAKRCQDDLTKFLHSCK